MAYAKTVEGYFEKNKIYAKQLTLLRKAVFLDELEETIKWGAPVYTLNGTNIVGLSAFKSYVGLWFFQGGLLKDKADKLVNAQENKTKAMRQWRFYSENEIENDLSLISAYVREAIDNEKAGKSIKPDRNKPIVIPQELQNYLTKNQELYAKFNQLSKSRQREYAEYISEAKREATRLNRLKKIMPLILNSAGLHDKYK